MNKKHLLFAPVLYAACFGVQAQILPEDYYRNYYTIQVEDGTSRVLDQKSNNYIWANSSHWGSNQQWIVMPMHVKADNGALIVSPEHLIGSRRDGDVVAFSTGFPSIFSVLGEGAFNGGNNQLWKLTPTSPGSNVFLVGSPADSGRVLDRSNNRGGHIFFAPLHGGNNQQFGLYPHSQFTYQFSPLRNFVRLAAPLPPEPESFTAQVVTETPKYFRAEMLLPYPTVKNDLAPLWQVEHSPFYRLARSQYYKLPESSDQNPDFIWLPGEGETRKFTTKVGMKATSVREVTRKLNVSFGGEGSVEGPLIKELTSKIAASIGFGLERTVKNIDTFEKSIETSNEVTWTYSPPSKIRLVIYQLIDHYELYRQDGTLVLDWDVATKHGFRVSYSEEPGGGRIRTGRAFTITNGAVIPIAGP